VDQQNESPVVKFSKSNKTCMLYVIYTRISFHFQNFARISQHGAQEPQIYAMRAGTFLDSFSFVFSSMYIKCTRI